jgi:hypothetical protein
MKKYCASVGVFALTLVALVGCSAVKDVATIPSEAHESSASVSSFISGAPEVSRAFDFATVDELAEMADLVVVVTVTEEFEKGELVDDKGVSLGGTVTERVVVPGRILKGEIATPDLRVWQLGDGHLEPGSTHLLFLTEYKFAPGGEFDSYAITGFLSGDYIQTSAGDFVKVDTESPKLPDTLPANFVLEQ